MKEVFIKLVNKARYGVAAVLVALWGYLPASAQTGENLGKEVIESSASALYDLLESVVTLLQIVMGLGAIVVLAIVIFKVFKGEREAAEKLAWWIAGLTLGFVLLIVVKNLIPQA